MKVWVLEWNYPNDGDFNVTLWASDKDAYSQACDEIKKKVARDWDMDDDDQAAAADEIDLHVSKGRMKEAVQSWNDYQDNFNSDYAQYFFIREQDVLSRDTSNAPTLPPPAAFKATTTGATCRKCNNSNEYAYADKPDGTYCCRQCAAFSTIFGTTPP